MALLVNQPLPPYTYVPGKSPHPTRDADGHRSPVPAAAASGPWWRDQAYLRGIDLFNHGFYWEAHEAWEAVWLVAGRRGPRADFMKALIKLAAALVKAREGVGNGVQRHARRSIELLRLTTTRFAARRVEGLLVEELMRLASRLAEDPQAVLNACDDPVVRLIPEQLVPQHRDTSHA